MLRSLRVRLTLWYVAILAAILGLFSLVLYANVTKSLHRSVDRSLALQADAVTGTVTAFWEADRGDSGPGNWISAPSKTLRAEIDAGRFPDLMSRWAAKTHAFDVARPLQLLDRDGRLIGSSHSFDQLQLDPPSMHLDDLLHGHAAYETRATADGQVRLLSRPVIEQGHVAYIVQVGTSLTQTEASLAELRMWLWGLIPLMLAVTTAAGFFMATTALKPVGEMITQAQRIGAERLEQRLLVPKTRDELQQLAITFNDMLARLERAFRRLRQFSAAASHELRTPLTVMRGELEVALRKPRETDEYRRVLRTHLEIIDEMSQTVQELLALARSEAVDPAIEWSPIELGALAKQVTDSCRPLADAKAVAVELPAAQPVWVRGERRLLERLVANLLDNAIRHTPSSGQVSVRADHSNGEACVIVQDTGPGIPPEELPQIFDRFFRRRPSSENGGSAGLGLGLCRWIVEAHHGRIDVNSQPKHGATFTVWLPAITPPAR